MTDLKAYIGDGVYVDFDGFGLVLTTENGLIATNTIYLEPYIWAKLKDYVETLNPAEKNYIEGLSPAEARAASGPGPSASAGAPEVAELLESSSHSSDAPAPAGPRSSASEPSNPKQS